MKKSIIIVGIVVALLVIVTSLIYLDVIPSEVDSGVEGSRIIRDPSTAPTDDIGSGRDDTVLDEEACTTSGGTWNPCGSACRTDPDAICIELCVEYCECKSDLECPSGYTCGDVVEGVGVCLSDAG